MIMDERFRYHRLDYDKEALVDLRRTSLEALVWLMQYALNTGDAEVLHLENAIKKEFIRRGRLMWFGRRD